MAGSRLTRQPIKADPFERDIERALRPGVFIGYGECSSFIGGLELVVAGIDKLIGTQPARAPLREKAWTASATG